MVDSLLQWHKRQEPGGYRAPGVYADGKRGWMELPQDVALRGSIAEGMAAGTATVVVQDVPVDGFTQTRTSGTARGPADDAIDDYAGGRTQQGSDRATQQTGLGSGHGSGDTAGRPDEGTERTAVSPGQMTRLDVD